MSAPETSVDVKAYVGMALAIGATILIAALVARSAPEPEVWTGREAYRRLAAARRAVPGVRATLSAGDVVLVRRLSALCFRLEPGRALDPALPAGPFRGVFEVTFDPAAPPPFRCIDELASRESLERLDDAIGLDRDVERQEVRMQIPVEVVTQDEESFLRGDAL